MKCEGILNLLYYFANIDINDLVPQHVHHHSSFLHT